MEGTGMRVYLLGGEYVDFPTANGYTIMGPPMGGQLRLWRSDPEGKEIPELLAIFPVGGWLCLKGEHMELAEHPMGFKNPQILGASWSRSGHGFQRTGRDQSGG